MTGYQQALNVGREHVGQCLDLVHKRCDLRVAGQLSQHAGSCRVLQNALAEGVENGCDVCCDLLDLQVHTQSEVLSTA